MSLDSTGAYDCRNGLFNSEEWLGVLSQSFGYQFISTEAGIAEPIVFAHIHDALGERLVCLPFTDYYCCDANHEGIEQVVEVLQNRYPQSYLHAKLMTRPSLAERVGCTYHMEVSDEGTMWANLTGSCRRAISKADRQEVRVRFCEDRDALDRLVRMLARNHAAKFGNLPPAPRFLFAIYERYIRKNKGFIVEAWKGGDHLASHLILIHNKTLYYKFGASDQRRLEFRPNNLLFWQLICFAIRESFQTVDLGLCTNHAEDAGQHAFKSSFGALSTPVSRILLSPINARSSEASYLIRRNTLFSVLQEVIGQTKDLDCIAQLSDTFFAYLN